MRPLFDFNGDGSMDMLEFLMATANNPDNPLNENRGNDEYDCAGENYDIFDCNETEEMPWD